MTHLAAVSWWVVGAARIGMLKSYIHLFLDHVNICLIYVDAL